MGFADKMLQCAQCGSQFIFTVDEQRRLAKSGREVVEPTYCPVCRTEEQISMRKIGRVKWFNERKGFGFIVQEDGDEVFVHFTGIEGEGYRTLYEGQQVEFEVEQTGKGPQAVHVIRLSETEEGGGRV